MYFYELLKKNRHLLNQTENEILEYLIRRTDKIDNVTIREVAKKNYTVPNTIVRLCQKLGFKGYTEFKECLKQTRVQKEHIVEITSMDEQIAKTKQLLNYTLIDKIITKIHSADRVLLFAAGLTRFPSEELNERLRIVGKNSQTFVDPHTMKHNARLLNNNDLAIALSISGETDNILQASTIASVSGAPTVSITGFSTNSLSKITDYQLYAYISPVVVNGLDAADRLCVHYLCNVLFQEYLNKYF